MYDTLLFQEYKKVAPPPPQRQKKKKKEESCNGCVPAPIVLCCARIAHCAGWNHWIASHLDIHLPRRAIFESEDD
jgi:hypothetical protein